MSSSQPKITSVTCPKCKQGFKFERVPKMTAVVCPHCDAKIRLTRKKSKSKTAEQPRDNPQPKDSGSREGKLKSTKPPRLSIPELSAPETEAPDAVDEEPQTDDFPTINTRRRRPRVNLTEFQFEDSDDSEAEDLDAPEEEEGDFPFIQTRRKRKRVGFDDLDLGDHESEPPKLVDPEPSEVTEPDDTPAVNTRRKLNKPVKLDQMQLDELAEPKANALERKPQRKQRKPTTKPDLVPERRSLPPAAPTIDSTRDSASIAAQTDLDSENDLKEAGDSSQAEADEEKDLANDLLPPKFLVPDIEADQNAVVLPTAGGGVQVVDKTEVRVMHEGRAVKLVALSPEELKRVRLIENLVALLIAAIMLAIAIWLVL